MVRERRKSNKYFRSLETHKNAKSSVREVLNKEDVIITDPKRMIFIADLLKTKAGTTHVNDELAKKDNNSILNSYVSNTEVEDLATKCNAALDVRITADTLANYSLTTAINNDLALKANIIDVNTLISTIN